MTSKQKLSDNNSASTDGQPTQPGSRSGSDMKRSRRTGQSARGISDSQRLHKEVEFLGEISIIGEHYLLDGKDASVEQELLDEFLPQLTDDPLYMETQEAAGFVQSGLDMARRRVQRIKEDPRWATDPFPMCLEMMKKEMAGNGGPTIMHSSMSTCKRPTGRKTPIE